MPKHKRITTLPIGNTIAENYCQACIVSYAGKINDEKNIFFGLSFVYNLITIAFYMCYFISLVIVDRLLFNLSLSYKSICLHIIIETSLS